ncbi:NAD(P)-dependent alcohol dehydrogenase [Mariniluteicoccus endophyticus]
MDLPDTMRASVLHDVRELRVDERPVPAPGPQEVLVRVASVVVSMSDVAYYSAGRNREMTLDGPLVLGRAASGTVAAVGDGVDEARVGERVALEPTLSCRRCQSCRSGDYNLCEDLRLLATPSVDGALREYMTLPAELAHPVGDLDLDAAAMIEPMSVAVAALRKAGIGAGSSLLITGAGPIGLITVAVAKAIGATRIVVTDLHEGRLEHAAALGATAVVNTSDPSNQIPEPAYDAFIECSGSPAAIRRGFPAVRPAGRVVLVGMGPESLSVPVRLLHTRELVVTGTYRYANTFPTAIAMARAGLVDLSGFVTHRFGLERVADALASTRDHATLKAVIHPGE